MQGVIVAVFAVIAATLLADYTENGFISLDGLWQVQRENFMLWILDALPFIFAYIGQYASYVLAHEASQLVLEQTAELRQQANELERQAAFAATHDLLTDLPNRALFYDRLEQAVRGADRPNAVLVVSIDNLKDIQDALGPTSADLVIKQLATRLANWAGKNASVARTENHRFAVHLTDGGDREGAEIAARGIIKAIEPSFVVNKLRLTLQTCIGIAVFPEHGDDADTLLQRAGVAEQFAANSLNSYSIYSPTMDELSPRRLTLMGELKRAIELNELQLFFQPKIDLASNRLAGVESLIRWHHTQHGFVPPDEFIAMAERTRIIRELSQWVLEAAFRHAAKWQQGSRGFAVSINLSTKDLNDPELPDVIAGILAKTGARPEGLIFEITEGSIMADPVRVLIVVERLRGMGFEFSIDDFGTGYSSLAYLKKLPVSELKIDKSFVMDMKFSQNDSVIVRATIDLAHNMGLKVTAEGIEDKESLEMLRNFGCDIGQGYFFSKPLPEEEFSVWLDQRWPVH